MAWLLKVCIKIKVMKKIMIALVALLAMTQSFAQDKEITPRNSWLKAGVNVGVPVGDLSDYSNFAAGIDVSGQYLVNPNFGIGLSTGYTHYFPKNNLESFGAVPVGALLRYYPRSKGFFAGTDVGYSFLTNSGIDGGFYLKPQLGYHNYDWNLYAFYNQIFTKSPFSDVQTVGIAAAYNIRFK